MHGPVVAPRLPRYTALDLGLHLLILKLIVAVDPQSTETTRGPRIASFRKCVTVCLSERDLHARPPVGNRRAG